MRHLRVTIVDVEKQQGTYYGFESVALIIQHAKRMRCVILSSVACLGLPYFFHIISQMTRFSEGKSNP